MTIHTTQEHYDISFSEVGDEMEILGLWEDVVHVEHCLSASVFSPLCCGVKIASRQGSVARASEGPIRDLVNATK